MSCDELCDVADDDADDVDDCAEADFPLARLVQVLSTHLRNKITRYRQRQLSVAVGDGGVNGDGTNSGGPAACGGL